MYYFEIIEGENWSKYNYIQAAFVSFANLARSYVKILQEKQAEFNAGFNII